jgi:chemotaxis signal transduction protein
MRGPAVNEFPVIDTLSPAVPRAVALREAFDRSFADLPRFDSTLKEDLVAIRIGDDVFAIRLSEISGLYANKKVTRVPGGDPALLGIAVFRSAILPVYSVATLLGHAAKALPRWLVIAAAAPIALAFDAFEHHLRVPSETIRPREASVESRPFVRHFVPDQPLVRPVLHLPSILDAIRMPRPALAPSKEQ